MKMNTTDKFGGGAFGSLQMPELHGHVKMRVWNPRTHKTEFEHEGDNIVTNAIPEILASNYLGGLSVSSMLPLADKWFGGVLAFEQPFSTVTIDGNVVPDPSKYFPDSEDVNKCIAHAGDTAPATAAIAAQDYKRGSPTDVVRTTNSLKYQWQWLPSQGCGIINSIALTEVNTGNAGLGSTSQAFANFSPWVNLGSLSNVTTSFGSANGIFAQYDDNHGLWFHIGNVNEYSYGSTLKTAGTSYITIVLHKLPYKKVGLNETLVANNTYNIAEPKQTSITFYNQPSYYFDYENKKLWLFTNIKAGGRSSDPAHVNYTVLDISDPENIIEDSYGTIDSSNIAPTGMEQTASSYNPSVAINANVIKDGNYIYLPTTSGPTWSDKTYTQDYFNINGYKKISLVDPDDQTDIPLGFSLGKVRSVMKGGGFIIGTNYVINGGTVYPCTSSPALPDASWNASPNAISWGCHGFSEPQSVLNYVTKIGGCSGSSEQPRYLLANRLILSTKYNLPAQVEKTGVQAMTIEYTLTEN